MLKKIGKSSLLFVTDGIEPHVLSKCNVTPATKSLSNCRPPVVVIQNLLQKLAEKHPAADWAVIPDGPYILIDPPKGL